MKHPVRNPLTLCQLHIQRFWTIFNKDQNDKRSMKLNLLILVVIFFDRKVCLFLFYAVKGTQKQNFVSRRTENVVKSGPAPGVTSLNIGRKKENSKCFFSETGRRRTLIFGILHFLVDFYKVCSYDASGVKSGSACPGGHIFKYRKKNFKILLLWTV